MRPVLKYIFVLLLIVLLDQGSKLWVYNHMQLGPDGHIKLLGNLFGLTYVLNYGMAFGCQLGFKYGKLFVTLVRMVASMGIAWHTTNLCMRSTWGCWVWGWILLLAGAIGNSIDSIFYGVYLDNAPDVAFMKWFHGQVIDMIHLDFWSGILPSWLPIWGGETVCVLPIFNLADVAIFVGLLCLLYASKRIDRGEKTQKADLVV